MESKVNKKFKKFAKALNKAYRKDGVYSIKVDAEIFNDRENRWGYKIVEHQPCVHGKPFMKDILSGYDCAICQGKYIKRMNIANGIK